MKTVVGRKHICWSLNSWTISKMFFSIFFFDRHGLCECTRHPIIKNKSVCNACVWGAATQMELRSSMVDWSVNAKLRLILWTTSSVTKGFVSCKYLWLQDKVGTGKTGIDTGDMSEQLVTKLITSCRFHGSWRGDDSNDLCRRNDSLSCFGTRHSDMLFSTPCFDVHKSTFDHLTTARSAAQSQFQWW